MGLISLLAVIEGIEETRALYPALRITLGGACRNVCGGGQAPADGIE